MPLSVLVFLFGSEKSKTASIVVFFFFCFLTPPHCSLLYFFNQVISFDIKVCFAFNNIFLCFFCLVLFGRWLKGAFLKFGFT